MNPLNIRLSQAEIDGLIKALNTVPAYAKLYLYGSRTNPNARGGDIDLLLVAQAQSEKQALIERKHYLLADIKKVIGDQHIDLSIATEAEIENDPFLSLIWPKAVLLHRW